MARRKPNDRCSACGKVFDGGEVTTSCGEHGGIRCEDCQRGHEAHMHAPQPETDSSTSDEAIAPMAETPAAEQQIEQFPRADSAAGESASPEPVADAVQVPGPPAGVDLDTCPTITRQVDIPLTDADLACIARELAEAERDLMSYRDGAADTRKLLTDGIKTREATVKALVVKIETGTSRADVFCAEVWNREARRVEYYRRDTGGYVESRPMTSRELEDSINGNLFAEVPIGTNTMTRPEPEVAAADLPSCDACGHTFANHTGGGSGPCLVRDCYCNVPEQEDGDEGNDQKPAQEPRFAGLEEV